MEISIARDLQSHSLFARLTFVQSPDRAYSTIVVTFFKIKALISILKICVKMHENDCKQVSIEKFYFRID